MNPGLLNLFYHRWQCFATTKKRPGGSHDGTSTLDPGQVFFFHEDWFCKKAETRGFSKALLRLGDPCPGMAVFFCPLPYPFS